MLRGITLELATSGLCDLGLHVSVPLFPSSVKWQNALTEGWRGHLGSSMCWSQERAETPQGLQASPEQGVLSPCVLLSCRLWGFEEGLLTVFT